MYALFQMWHNLRVVALQIFKFDIATTYKLLT